MCVLYVCTNTAIYYITNIHTYTQNQYLYMGEYNKALYIHRVFFSLCITANVFLNRCNCIDSQIQVVSSLLLKVLLNWLPRFGC